ncbi:MAG TPA: ECF transporter S component [Halanaerobiales bacterium]|nr:ECF transporter S component [Halanaerobiales bacterium]
MKFRKLSIVSIFSALAFIIMIFEINIPIFPFFLKLDFSEVPAIILAYLLGPIYGVMVVFLKNLLHLFISSNMGIGELANFLVGASFVASSAYFYQKRNLSYLFSSLIGTLTMGITSILVNLFVIIPLYKNVLNLPFEKILALTEKVNPYVNNLFTYLTLTIFPFNILKAALILLISYFIFIRIKKINYLK